MTRKDFELIAGVIQSSRDNYEGYSIDAMLAIETLARKMSNALAHTNDRFNRETFLTACGVK